MMNDAVMMYYHHQRQYLRINQVEKGNAWK